MLTLELKAQFEDLATRDHEIRIQSLLTELDTRQKYSAHADFPEVVSSWIEQLNLRGIRSAYHQACVLFSLMACDLEFESIPLGQDAQIQVAHCVSSALLAGVPRGAFQHIHRVLSGVGFFNEAWISPEPEHDCLNTLSNPLTNCGPVDVPCSHTGYTGSTSPSLESVHDQATFLRTTSGFQHKISASFPVPRLLSKVCQGALSPDPWCVNPHPVFDQCEIGLGATHGFAPLQKLRLVDARQASLSCQKRGLELPDLVSQLLDSDWKKSGLLRESTLLLEAPVMYADLAFSAGWVSQESSFAYATHGELGLSVSAGGIDWQGSLIHEGCLAQLSICLPQDFRLSWSLEGCFPVGQLPVGSPFLIRQQNIPLHAQLNCAICVGKPVLSLTNPIAGHLSLRLLVTIDPQTRQLGLTLELGHSQLVCEWQAADALLGWTFGEWDLLPESTVHTWDLRHG
ncbi:MAG: hypothetical protein O9274_10115 [Limnobacter sp.]|uniref:hypothetical protein n=1 Tax=Limnobacter sp. TaxID=2003368 RepID=UPI0022BAC18C|nr:hypothetical protein [Limnobacter sp.]MCZ8016040.1 hypothetical protein [Limnobacter sp.]